MRSLAILFFAGLALKAETPRDAQIEFLETNYRAFADGTGEIRYDERIRALTSQGPTFANGPKPVSSGLVIH